MILLVTVLALSIPGQSAQSIECANSLDRRTEFHSTADGLKIALQVRAADDHSKESYLCMTDYSLVITRPDGTSTERELESIDDAWGRSSKFWIDGFASQGRWLIATIAEGGGENPTLQIVVYSLQSDKADIFQVPRQFITQLSSSCQESLRAIGITRLVDPVIGFRKGACDHPARAWRLRQGPLVNGVQKPSLPILLPDDPVIEPVEPGDAPPAP